MTEIEKQDITPSPRIEETKEPIVEITPDIVLKSTSVDLQHFDIDKTRMFGQGGTSLVYGACEKKTSNCNYAVKIIYGKVAYPKSEKDCLNYLERMKQEILISHMMSDIGIGPKVFETAIDKNNKIGYIVMEKYEGTLPDLIFQNDENEEVIDFAKQIKPLLTKMHGQGIIHGNLRPKNILFKRNKDQDKIKLAISDFGQAFFSNDRRLIQADFDRLFRSRALVSPRFIKGGTECIYNQNI